VEAAVMDTGRKYLFGIPFHAWSMDQTVQTIHKRIESGIFTQHVVINVAKVVNAQKDAELKGSIEACDIINVDGMGVVWGCRALGLDVPERVAGVDLFMNLIKLSEDKGFPVFLLGARDDVVKKAAATLKQKYPNLKVAGYHHGYFWGDEATVVKQIKESGARLLFVAITSPKKENFINKWKDELGVDFVMGVGGTFDVVAGKVKRAPLWMQKYGLEWLYRVIQEPRRMWKRYLVTNSQFLWYLFVERISRK
jgi:N-acetylglucosaminyldiphosphoundecaprenol N-acetyl-beta-D-mannosaminyltransferase